MEAAMIIQLITLVLPYVIKFLEQAESMEEVKEMFDLIDRLAGNDDLINIVRLFQKLN